MSADPRRVKELFGAAVAIPDPSERDALLARECGGDRELRQRLDALLHAHDHPRSALDRPLAVVAPEPDRTVDHRGPTAVGDVIDGRYKLLERIGEGGMGEVWVADQLDPIRRRVALKMIKPGMDSRSVLARFEAERQALALMDHPNVAKVFDAGSTADGRPFFVMELVKGTPITEFCDIRKLPPKERLELFVPVCQAIQHAHQKGIIHRDLKPGNVLVALHDETPVPKVIDFGVAKAVGHQLTEKTLYTGFGALVGTPAYMAPEQATFNQLDIDTRADVYALGVLLYELLAGSPPVEPERLKRAALDEVLRLVREEEPPRPSARLSTSQSKATIAAVRQSDPVKLSALMKGELDWIVMKALEKDRTRRYDTATGLAKDVQRYLAGDAVEACPPTLGYRLKKAYRRNRAAVLVGSAFTAVLMVATGVSLAFGVHAEQSRRFAEVAERQADADRVAAEWAQAEATRNEELARTEAEKVKVEQGRTRRLLYDSQMTTATNALAMNQTGRLLQALDDTRPKPGEPDLRGWEWHYLDRLTRSDRVMPLDPGESLPNQKTMTEFDRVATHTFSHDGRWFASPRRNDEVLVVNVYETATGRRTGRIPNAGGLPVPSNSGGLGLLLSDDGKHLLLIDGNGVLKSDFPRLWDVSRGEPVPDCTPPKVRRFADPRSVILGPSAAWLTWIEDRTANGANNVFRGPRDITVLRWDRSTGAITRTPLKVGAGNGQISLGPDLRTVYWTPRAFVGPPSLAEPGPDEKGVLECWDVQSKARRWSIPVPGRGSTNTQINAKFSPGTASVLIVGPKQAAVHRTSDGTVLWKADLPADLPANGSEVQYLLSDDGNRIVIKWLYTLAVVENRPDGPPATRRFLFREPLAKLGLSRSGLSPLRPTLLPDGRTLAALDGSGRDLHLWDVSRDPEDAGPAALASVRTHNSSPHLAVRFRPTEEMPFAPNDLHQSGGVARSPDGKRSAKATVVPPNPNLAANPRLANRVSYAGPVIVSADGREVAHLEVPNKHVLMSLQFLESGLLFVTQSTSQIAADLGIGSDWAVYDPAAGGKLEPVTKGEWQCYPIPGTPYLFASDDMFINAGVPTGVGGYRILHAATGQEAFARTAPRGEEFIVGVNSFHPVSGRFVEVRRAVKPKGETTTLHLGVCEIATGKEVWATDLGPVTVQQRVNPNQGPPPRRADIIVAIAPGGERFVVTHTPYFLPFSPVVTEPVAHVWFARLADGGDLRAVQATCPPGTGSGFQFAQRGFSQDGREVALALNTEVQTWNLETGELTHRMTRHPNPVTDVLFSDDRTRIFTVSRDASGSSQRLHVWDTATDREVFGLPLAVQVQSLSVRSTSSIAGLNGAKLVTMSGRQVRVLDGTPLPEPKP